MKMYNFTVNITVEASDDDTATDILRKALRGVEDYAIEDGPNELEEED